MLMVQKIIPLPFLVSSFINAFHAYIDPNTGGMLFQLLAVFFALFSGFLFFFSRQIKSFFARLKRSLRRKDDPIEMDKNEEV